MNRFYANMGTANTNAGHKKDWDLIKDINSIKASGINGINANILKDYLLICKLESTY